MRPRDAQCMHAHQNSKLVNLATTPAAAAVVVVVRKKSRGLTIVLNICLGI